MRGEVIWGSELSSFFSLKKRQQAISYIILNILLLGDHP